MAIALIWMIHHLWLRRGIQTALERDRDITDTELLDQNNPILEHQNGVEIKIWRSNYLALKLIQLRFQGFQFCIHFILRRIGGWRGRRPR